jgi:hypothetical protein
MWRKPILELRGLDDRNYSVVDYVTGKSLGTVSGGITTAHSSNVKFPDGSIHDVMVLPSMANIVRGVDAHDGAALWSVTLGTPVNGNTAIGPKKTVPDGYVGDFPTIDCHAINDKWGVLSTGVIDPDTQRVYLVSWISPDGTAQNVKHFVFVLNVADGTQVVAPVLVTGTSGTQSYSSTMRKQRSSLVLTNVNGRKTVFWASGTVQETGNKAAGWIFALDCATNSIAAALATSQGEGAGIWMGGQGLAADAQGFLYAITGNGDFDGKTQFGESFVKVQYTPASGGTKASLEVIDHRTPWTDLVRSGQARLPATKLAGQSAPSEAAKPVGSRMNLSLKDARVTGISQGLMSSVMALVMALKDQLAAGGAGRAPQTSNKGRIRAVSQFRFRQRSTVVLER